MVVTFNYVDQDTYEIGTGGPVLYLPWIRRVQFELTLAGRHPLVLDPAFLSRWTSSPVGPTVQ